MIIYYDNNYPILVLEILSFLEIDYKTVKKNIEYILDLSNKNETYINIYIDLYNLQDYSMIYVRYLLEYLTYINVNRIKFINKVNLYVNENNNIILLKLMEYINNGLSKVKINIIKISKKKKWK
tara:strand:- start:97 stop:468 length:372 start_codon:yes stop_codon:yes gene_type:complete